MIKSIILAAGKGTRMKSEKSKVLHTIFDKALLGYVIEAVNKTGYVDERDDGSGTYSYFKESCILEKNVSCFVRIL